MKYVKRKVINLGTSNGITLPKNHKYFTDEDGYVIIGILDQDDMKSITLEKLI